jgi:mono/diheme cytochrome c family protein
MIDEGRQIFHGSGGCVTCHGDQLEGSSVAPTLHAHKWKDAGNGSYDDIKKVISDGVQGTAMVSHPGGISDDQVAKVAAYVWAVSQGKTKP